MLPEMKSECLCGLDYNIIVSALGSASIDLSVLYFQVYAYNKELYSADGYYAIPVDELAFSYFLASYDEANIATQFAVSATTDCSVQVELPSITTSMSV